MITRKPRNSRAFFLHYDPATGVTTKIANPTKVRVSAAMFKLNELKLPDDKHIPIEDMIFSEDLENLTIAEEIINNLKNNTCLNEKHF